MSLSSDTNSNRPTEDISNQSNNRLETLRQWLPWAQPSNDTTLPTSYSTSDGEGIEGLSCPRVNEVLSIIKSLNKLPLGYLKFKLITRKITKNY